MNYSYTEKFTMVPKAMANSAYLNGIFEIGPNEEVGSQELAQYDAILYYAQDTPDRLPVIYRLLLSLDDSIEHNKLSVSYNREIGVVFVAAAQGKRLLIANSYRASDFTTAFYYISLVTQQVMFNPNVTLVRLLDEVGPEDEALLNSYYKGIEYIK